MKRFFVFLFLCVFAASLIGCDMVGTEVVGAYVTVVNPDWHEKGMFRVGFAEEDSLSEKYIDIWIKSNKTISVEINEEFEEPFTLEMQSGTWYSLTTEICIANDMENEENFVTHKESVLRTFTITAQEELTVAIKVVAGDREKNFAETGWLLTNRKDASKEACLKVGPRQPNQSL